MSSPQDPTSQAPEAAAVTSTIARLRAEQKNARSAAANAVLLHEIGVLEERIGDEAGAARDQLAAVNAEPDFHEPLERLIAIIERRQSYNNLGKLLERLVNVSQEPEERTRSLIERALHLIDHDRDLEAAREALETASVEAPDVSAVWLLLELVGAKLSDPGLRVRALEARSGLTEHATWRALLTLDRAELLFQAGDPDAALAAVQSAVDQPSPATFAALRALERLAEPARAADFAALSRACLSQCELIQASLTDPAGGDAVGVPRHLRTPHAAADCLLRAAEAERALGNLSSAGSALDRALELLPGEPSLIHARLTIADLSGDTSRAAELAGAVLAHGLSGALAAAMHLRVAEAAASSGDRNAALEAVRRALAEDPRCVPARALELDLLSSENQPAELSQAFEAAAEQMQSDAAKARFYLMSADACARIGRDAQAAKAALSQAAMFGDDPALVARIARTLATIAEDPAWHEDATRRVLAAGASDDEQVDLWLDLTRDRLRRGDRAQAAQALDALSKTPEGGWLGPLLSAYVLPLAGDQTTGDKGAGEPAAHQGAADLAEQAPLSVLAAQETEPARARALRLSSALRHRLAGVSELGRAELEALHAEDAADLVPALLLAQLLRADQPERAAQVLASTARALNDRRVAGSLELEASLIAAAHGLHDIATEYSNQAKENVPKAASLVQGWALRFARPDDKEARRQALSSAGSDAVLGEALERFALEVDRDGDPERADEALRVAAEAPSDLGLAAELARSLFQIDEAQVGERIDALGRLTKLGPRTASLAHAALYQAELGRGPDGPDWTAAEPRAAHWAASDDDPVAGLEWLAAAIAVADPVAEITARQTLARRLGGSAAAELRASAAIVQMLHGDDALPLLEGDHPSTCLANLELSLPGGDPLRRARSLLGVRELLGDESVATLETLAGFNYLAGGEAVQAAAAFRRVVETHPEDMAAWEGLRAAAERLGDRAQLAEACAALGDLVREGGEGARLWEEAALILIDELEDEQRGEFALSRAVERDITRFVAFDRLFRMVRARKDGPRLLELIERRLRVADDPAEVEKLYWERARVLRIQGDKESALSALNRVTELEPDHVGALALAGEIYLTLGRFEEAADHLARLAAQSSAPTQQRLMSGVAAVDIYENKLSDTTAALAVLAGLHDAGLSTLPVRERLARAATKAADWERATATLERLVLEREDAAGRVEAARLAMVIYRDKLQDLISAGTAATKILSAVPGDAEALEVLLQGGLPYDRISAFLERGQEALVEAAMADPTDVENIDRLARVAMELDDAPLRQAALGVLVALGEGTSEIDDELTLLDRRVAHVPQIAIDDGVLAELADPEDSSPIASLFQLLAPTFAGALGPGLVAFGIGRKERVDPRAGLPIRNEVAAWAGAIGLGDFELYVGGNEDHGVFGIPGDVPIVVVGRGVTAPLGAIHRQAVARELLALKRGTSILRHREASEIAALVVASARIGGVSLPSPAYALLAEFERLVGKALPRRLRRPLSDLAAALERSGQDPLIWYAAATSTLDRMAALSSGDVSWVLAEDRGQRGKLGQSHEEQERARRLLSFVLSPNYLRVREHLGMTVR